MPLTAWPSELIEQFVNAGFHTIVFDNRDIGQSKHYDEFKKPKLALAVIKHKLGLRVKSAYKLSDLADDAIHLLDELNIETAHIIGISMGGMIGQHLCANYRKRVLSFVQIMSTSGARGLPGTTKEVTKHIMKGPSSFDREAIIAYNMETQRLIGTKEHPLEGERLRTFVESNLDQGQTSAGIIRQTHAIIADGDRSNILANIQAPTLVIHGTEDPLVRVEGGRDAASKIKDAILYEIPNMGHDLPPSLLDEIAQQCINHAKQFTKDDE